MVDVMKSLGIGEPERFIFGIGLAAALIAVTALTAKRTERTTEGAAPQGRSLTTMLILGTYSLLVVALTHAAIADMAGTSRETVSRFLAQLERAGVLTCGRRQLTIHRPAALRNYIY